MRKDKRIQNSVIRAHVGIFYARATGQRSNKVPAATSARHELGCQLNVKTHEEASMINAWTCKHENFEM